MGKQLNPGCLDIVVCPTETGRETPFTWRTHCQVWDLGGQTSIRPYWRCYYPNTDAIVFVVDSSDRERMSIAKQELMAMLEVSHTSWMGRVAPILRKS